MLIGDVSSYIQLGIWIVVSIVAIFKFLGSPSYGRFATPKVLGGLIVVGFLSSLVTVYYAHDATTTSSFHN